MSRPFFDEPSGLCGAWYSGPDTERRLQINQTVALLPSTSTRTRRGDQHSRPGVSFVQMTETQWRALGRIISEELERVSTPGRPAWWDE